MNRRESGLLLGLRDLWGGARRVDLGEGAWLYFEPGFVSEPHALMERLLQELPLRSEMIRICGRMLAMPRLVSWHGDPGCDYAYSGRCFSPSPWTPALSALASRLSALGFCDLPFNSALANYYRDGCDSMAYHSDDEPEVGPSPMNRVIASVSLGDSRRFLLKHKKQGTLHRFELGEGSLLVMGGTTQSHYRHGVPKTKQPCGPRLNLTYRVLVER